MNIINEALQWGAIIWIIYQVVKVRDLWSEVSKKLDGIKDTSKQMRMDSQEWQNRMTSLATSLERRFNESKTNFLKPRV